MERSKTIITLSSNFNPVVHDSLRPLLVFWRFTGLFPTSTLGQIPNRMLLGRVEARLNWTIVITVIVALLSITSLSLFLSEAAGMKMSDVIDLSLPIFFTCDCIAGLLSTLFMIRMSSAFMRYLIKWSTISGAVDFKSLRCLSVKLVIFNAVFIMIAIILEAVSIINFDISGEPKNTTFTPPDATKYKINCVHLISNIDLIRMTSVVHLAIFFTRCVQLHLAHLNLQLDVTELTSAFQLTELRNTYNRVVNMVDELATILSPVLLLILAENTVTMTVDIASLYEAIRTHDVPDSTVYCSIFNKIWYRLAQMAWLCSCGEEMGVMGSTMSLHGVMGPLLPSLSVIANLFDYDLDCVLLRLNLANNPQKIITKLLSKSCHITIASTKFQFDLLQSCLVQRIPSLDASGYLRLNNALLLQVIGILVTYTVLMAQMNS